MKKQYSFGDDSYESNGSYLQRMRVRRNWHTPQSRETARNNTLGSFSSITTRYNNVYGNHVSNDKSEQQ